MAITTTLTLAKIEVTKDPYVIRGIQDCRLASLTAAHFERIRYYQPFRYKTLNLLDRTVQRAIGRTKTVLASQSQDDTDAFMDGDLTLYSPVAVSEKFGSFCISAAAHQPPDGVDMAFEASLACYPHKGFTLHAATTVDGRASNEESAKNNLEFATFDLEPIAEIVPTEPLPAHARSGLALVYFALEKAY